jgi:hypothetical protein
MELAKADWDMRLFIYEALAASGYAPSARELGARRATAAAQRKKPSQFFGRSA